MILSNFLMQFMQIYYVTLLTLHCLPLRQLMQLNEKIMMKYNKNVVILLEFEL
jgi:hypothetical protein